MHSPARLRAFDKSGFRARNRNECTKSGVVEGCVAEIGGCRRMGVGNRGLTKPSRNRVKSCATFSGIPRVSFGWSRWERCDALPLWWQFQTFVPHGSSIARRVRAAGKAIGLDWSNCSSWRSMLQAADGSGNPAARVPFARLGPHLGFSLNGAVIEGYGRRRLASGLRMVLSWVRQPGWVTQVGRRRLGAPLRGCRSSPSPLARFSRSSS